jgi:hypothetical protein
MAKQALIFQIEEDLAREVRNLLSSSGRGYGSLSEFVEVALINQLGAEQASRDPADAEGDPLSTPNLLLPPAREPETWATRSKPSSEGLFVLTNRFGPMKIAARVLANMEVEARWPDLRTFQDAAAGAARELGLRLRREDEAGSRTGSLRRWVAFPVGSDVRAAGERFAFSFTLAEAGGVAVGPMATLGLANVDEGRAGLTRLGWRLAVAPSPLLGEAPGLRFSPEESAVMREAIRQAPGELALVEEFISLVRDASGAQPSIDDFLAKRHNEWTQDLAVAHRSAMLGRLADLEILEVTGRGPKARITLMDAADEFGGTESDQVHKEETS